jgi:hypothetical protein
MIAWVESFLVDSGWGRREVDRRAFTQVAVQGDYGGRQHGQDHNQGNYFQTIAEFADHLTLRAVRRQSGSGQAVLVLFECPDPVVDFLDMPLGCIVVTHQSLDFGQFGNGRRVVSSIIMQLKVGLGGARQ